MTDSIREYHRPADIGEAARLLRRQEVRTVPLMLGPRVPDELLAGVEAVVDLSRLDLAGVRRDGDGNVRIGALTPLQVLVESAWIRSLASGVLAEAAWLSGASAMRNVATVGGAIAQIPAAAPGMERAEPPEVPVALLALEADLVFDHADQALLEVPLAEYVATNGMAAMEGLLLEVRIAPRAHDVAGALARVARSPRDQALVVALALLAIYDGRLSGVRLAIGGACPQPVRISAAERALEGMALDAAALQAVEQAVLAAIDPITDYRASAEYRRAMAAILAKRAVSEAYRKAAAARS